MEHWTAIILAGGKSSRMGEDKGLMLYQGKRMIQHVIDAVLPLTNRIIISANSNEYKQFNYPVVADIQFDKGPVSGIVSALAQSQSEFNWVLSCDSPNISTKLLQDLADQLGNYEAVVPKTSEKIHPIIAVYRKTALNQFSEHLALDRLKMTMVLDQLNVNYYRVEEVSQFKNINTKSDL